MKIFGIALFCLSLALPSLAESAENSEGIYWLVSFKGELKEAIKGDESWMTCGDYFAVAESTEGKIIHFNFEKLFSTKLSPVFAFSPISKVIVSVDQTIETPIVVVLGDNRKEKFILIMNANDYRVGLPCLANGKKV